MTKLFVLGSSADLKTTELDPNPKYLHLGTAGKIIHFIRKWNPHLHPRDSKGRFIETPDKQEIFVADAVEGDVLVSKAGSAFYVAKSTTDFEGGFQKTDIEVQPIDVDTGQIKGQIESKSPDLMDKALRAGNVSAEALDRTTIEDLEAENPLNERPDSMEARIAKRLANVLGIADWQHYLDEIDKEGLTRASDNERWSKYLQSKFQGELPPAKADRIVRSIRTDTLWQTAVWAHDMHYGMERAENPNPADAGKLAIADALDSNLGRTSQIGPFLDRASLYNAETADEMARLLRDLDPTIDGSVVREIAEAAIQNAERSGVAPFPETRRHEAEKLAIVDFIRKEGPDLSPHWKTDIDNLSRANGQDSRRAWLEDWLDPEMSDTDRETALARLDKQIDKEVGAAKDRWRQEQRRQSSFDPDVEHSVPLKSSFDVYRQLKAGLSDDPDNYDLSRFNPEMDINWTGRNSVSRQVIYDMAVAHQRGIDHGEFGLPRWDDIEFEDQTFKEIDSLLEGTEDKLMDVPVFYQSGYVKDGVLQMGKDREGYAHTFGYVDQELDDPVAEIFHEHQAHEKVNSQDLSKVFDYEGSGELYPGSMLELVDEEPRTEEVINRFLGVDTARVRLQSVGRMIADYEKNASHDYPPYGFPAFWREVNKAFEEYTREEIDVEETIDKIRQGFLDTADSMPDDVKEAQLKNPDMLDRAPLRRLLTPPETKIVDPGKRIEYVPHRQSGDDELNSQDLTTGVPTTGAPTSQRGQLRMIGHSPQEATKRLQELGIVGDMEPKVAFNSVLRSHRHYGRVLPLHSEYVRGDKDLPETKERISHGVTGEIQDTLQILETGSILPISERIRLGMTDRVSSSTSQKGDVRSGLDEGVFANVGMSTWGNEVIIIYKDSAFLRRDVIVAPEDFGAGPSRYDDYLSYKRKIRREGGLRSRTDWDDSLEPEARQAHLDIIKPGNEWNVFGGVPVEDWELIYVKSGNESAQREIEARLKVLQKQGVIAEIPKVTTDPAVARSVVNRKETVVGMPGNPMQILHQIKDVFPEGKPEFLPTENKWQWVVNGGIWTLYFDVTTEMWTIRDGSGVDIVDGPVLNKVLEGAYGLFVV